MKLINFFKKHYWFFLALVVLVSYGQLLLMYPWQDDHALMFKLANIEGRAGYLGAGIFGEGPYKYTAAFYYPIYLLFGYRLPLYFLLSLIMYFLATLSVYKVFSKVIGEGAGRVAGFIFAAGYIASDGFIRLYNSVGTSLSIILISFLLLCYWYFFKRRKIKWYFFALISYFLAVEFIRYRTHYLIVVPVAFELLFLAFRKPSGPDLRFEEPLGSEKAHPGRWPLKSVASSLARLAPFIFVFYRYFVLAADERSGKIRELVSSLLKGQFDKLYSFFASLANLVVPDWLSRPVLSVVPPRILSLLSGGLFSSPALNLSLQGKLIPVFGIFLMVLGLWLTTKIKKNKQSLAGSAGKKLYFFLLFWLLVNIAGYAAYEPTVAHETTNRFLAHSFFALAGLMGLVAQEKKRIYLLVVLFGVGNLFNSFALQRNIVTERSRPAKAFYKQLKDFIPKLEGGDILYFDIKDSRRQNFADAFSVAQMPEETAIAWHYGVDRYDIRRVTDYETLTKLRTDGGFTDINKEPLKLNKIYSFFYSGDGVIETTNQLVPLLKGRSATRLAVAKVEKVGDDIIIDLSKPTVSLAPTEINFALKATPPNLAQISFPYSKDVSLSKNRVAQNDFLRKLAFDYKNWKERFQRGAKVSATSFWQKDAPTSLVDGRSDTSWRADRVLWSKEGTSFTIDLGEAAAVDRFAWANGNASNSPTKYEIDVSTDNKNWKKVAEVTQSTRIEGVDLQVVSFEPINARFVRMVLLETLSRDSASIAEAWVVPSTFSKLDIKEAEQFLMNPFGFVPDAQSFASTLSQMGYLGEVQVSWFGDKSDSWQTDATTKIKVTYDGVLRSYHLLLPAGGTRIDKLKFTPKQIPGTITLISTK